MEWAEGPMIPSLKTDRMWARQLRLEDAEQVQKIFFPQWEVVKHLGWCPGPYHPDGMLTSNVPFLIV
jgi:hypothetical protein